MSSQYVSETTTGETTYNIGNSVSCDPLHPWKVLITPRTYNTEHNYINFGLFEGVTEVKHNSNSMGRGASLPIPDAT